ncbi:MULTISPECIES: toxin-activating lysine-acyltransferase [Rhizobium/Agrobacterium group]|uniref:RTX toxin-activating lysine-acyltransferase n=1 Tax=Rhizobium rhizogenes TaxID=359 RepID=A0AA92C1B2_RHIRH|nr:toxin-activating lysine-acyltransferase [Rhizobium rhizogenes]PVE52242.1 toxin-activating lysine-acyltransferase [Rhizobium rhizogenes]PVE62051.1 toxin-activating lysine-acyltransferase [Agrobacterium tumefaciens]PVE69833.1 toxin-activating lysine-acyltransferase [Sphingomonas sp. TPD3009]
MENTKQVKVLTALESLGSIIFLAMNSPVHRNWLISDVETNFLPALSTGQCKIYFAGPERPIAFVTWAIVDDATHSKLLEDGITPHESKWASGKNLWFIDVVAPFGDSVMVIRDMRKNYFSGQNAYSIRRNTDGSIKRFQRWFNVR